MNVQHSSRSDRWYTPTHILDMVRQVIGRIDFDPASEEGAQERVKAGSYAWAKGELPETPWPKGTVFCNPPGGKKGNRSMAGLFWKRMMQHRDEGMLTQGVFLCFSIGALQHTQRLDCEPITHFPICIPEYRVAFDYPTGVKGSSPSHPNAIIYVPGTMDDRWRFADIFSQIGTVMNMEFHS